MSQFIEMFGDDTTRKSLCEICRPKQWPTIQTKDFTEDGYLVYGANGVIGHYKEYNHKYPTILMACRGASCGAINVSEPESYITGNAMCLDDLSNEVCFEFLVHFLTYYDYKTIITGGAQPQITITSLQKIEIPIPPKKEQEKFVAIARQADKSEFGGFKSQFIEEFGGSKSIKPLSDFIDVSFPGEWGQEDKNGDGVKVIRTTNFTNIGKLDLTDVVTRDIDAAKVEKKKLKKGDILLERSGGTNDNPVGRVVYFDEEGTFLFNNFTQLLRCKEGVNPTFLFYSLFNYYWMNKRAIRGMGNKTTGIQNLKMDKYWQIPIADVPIECQEEFESIYNQADKSEKCCEIRLAG